MEVWSGGLLERAARRVRQLRTHARRHGVLSTAYLVRGAIGRLVPARSRARGRLVVIAPRLDLSGAPLVAVQMAIEARQRHAALAVALVTYPPAHAEHLGALRQAGITVQVIPDPSMLPRLRRDDVVVLNTAAAPAPVRHHVLRRLRSRSLRRVVWLVHEGSPEHFIPDEDRRVIAGLLRAGSLRVHIAAQQATRRFIDYIGTDAGVEPLAYRIDAPERARRVLRPEDFHERIRFVLPGSMVDGRKGQLPVLYALSVFLRDHGAGIGRRYRDFELVLIGVEHDFLSQQVRQHRDVLQGRLELHGTLSRAAYFDVLLRCNVTVCYSVSEGLPLFVYEGMLAGHPILRNDSSGVDEQLVDGGNGMLLDSRDFWSMAATFERVLDRRATSDDDLARMSRRSHEMAAQHLQHRYLDVIDQEIGMLLAEPRARLASNDSTVSITRS